MKNILILLLFSAVIGFAQTGTDKIKVTDLTKIKQVVNIAMSPDGSRALYALRTIEPNEENKLEYDYRTHLYLTDFLTIKQITRGAESVSNAAWSPDGRSIAFTRAVKGKSQVFIMPLDGGEAFQLTDSKYGAANPQWSKTGSHIIFSVNLGLSDLVKDSLLNPNKVVPLWSLEKPGFASNDFIKPTKDIKPNPDGTLEEIRAYLLKDEEDKKAKVINRLNFQGEATTQPELTFNHLFMIEAKEGAKSKALTSGFKNHNNARWLANGNILFETDFHEHMHPDRELESAVSVLDTQKLTTRMLLGENRMNYAGVFYAPNGARLSFFKSPTEGVNFPNLFIANADGTNAQQVPIDRSAANVAWSKDSRYLYFAAPSNGGQPLYRFEVGSAKVEQLSDTDTGILAFDVSTDKVLYAKTEVANPNELYVADIMGRNARKLTNHNDWVKNKALSFPEKRYYTNSKGMKIEYWIMKPAQTEAGKKYPLLLQMHGGPTAMWGPGEFSMWHEFQYFCAQGYGIVYANPRGSGGYGIDFQRANIKDWGISPAEDVLGAASAATKEAWVDTARQVITGGSYAGYLTAWIVAHDHRFKAAFSQRGVYDLTTFMGEGNAWRLIPNYFNYPWNDKTEKILESNSPYTFVENIRTPLLIKHGENDLRTGVIQSEMLYKSLKILGKDVEYVRVPGATHELSRSGNVRQRIDRMLRIYEFFERYIGKK